MLYQLVRAPDAAADSALSGIPNLQAGNELHLKAALADIFRDFKTKAAVPIGRAASFLAFPDASTISPQSPAASLPSRPTSTIFIFIDAFLLISIQNDCFLRYGYYSEITGGMS
ncbi:hypothetical protein [Pedobacter sp. SYSU D00535]|uniref:hypothetical protein n=1 Tax=Pedobacter sp. SYSU D00535 TaxID=2810308 RepID=UPI001A95D9F8|nr:hypothetical protein [Pedobacter sp. SYSU D00535]